MININNLSNASLLNSIQLQEEVTTHLEFAKKCEEFFSDYKKSRLTKEGNLSADDYYGYYPSFFKMYNQIVDRCVEKWEIKYNLLSENVGSNLHANEEVNSKLQEIKNNIDQCKKADALFCKAIIRSFRVNPGSLQYKDSLFFFPSGSNPIDGVISECHCSEALMGRESRQWFSRQLSSGISDVFADKTKPLTIASIGAGQCFHELEIHALVTQAGHTIDRWIIVDPHIFPKVIENFQTILRWENRNVEVLTETKECAEYFKQIGSGVCENLPDVFLFIDSDLWITSEEISRRTKQLNHRYLFAEFRKESCLGDALNFWTNENI